MPPKTPSVRMFFGEKNFLRIGGIYPFVGEKFIKNESELKRRTGDYRRPDFFCSLISYIRESAALMQSLMGRRSAASDLMTPRDIPSL